MSEVEIPGVLSDLGECIQDRFDFRGLPGTNPPTICGENKGQHMFIDAGFDNFEAIRILATFTDDFDRRYRIKVNQYTCGSLAAPEPGCLNYLTGISGQVRSFNFVREDRSVSYFLGNLWKPFKNVS